MASIDYITKRIDSKQAEIMRLEKKLDRIAKAEASGWEDNPYYYDERDKRSALHDLEAAKAALFDWQQKLEAAVEKAESRNVQAILQFLDAWKRRCFEWYEEAIKEAAESKNELRRIAKEIDRLHYGSEEREALETKFAELSNARYCKLCGYYEEKEVVRSGRTRAEKVKVRDGEWEHAKSYIHTTYEEGIKKLRMDLDEEANRKYDFIIERATAITGKITDATALSVGETGELNGYIKGEKGTAKIQTIGAGGYNIQCFHFRTLIRKM